MQALELARPSDDQSLAPIRRAQRAARRSEQSGSDLCAVPLSNHRDDLAFMALDDADKATAP